jgi:signal transduction histidine kinase
VAPPILSSRTEVTTGRPGGHGGRSDTTSTRPGADRVGDDDARIVQLEALYESTIQSLDAIANGMVDEGSIRSVARGEAMRLRQALAVGHDGSRLDEELGGMAQECASHGLQVDHFLVGAVDLAPDVHGMLISMVREVLRDAVDRGARRAVVRVEPADEGVRTTIRDHGRGTEAGGHGADPFAASMSAQLDGVGGRILVWSEPDRGKRVTIWTPAGPRSATPD